MAKKNSGLSFSKCMLEIKDDNTIILVEHDKEGNEYYFNFTEEMRKLQNESNINVKVTFDNEIDWD